MARTITTDEPLDTSSPWASNANRFPDDMTLRAAHFRIHRRPSRSEAIWLRNGQTYGHREALAIVRAERKQQKR